MLEKHVVHTTQYSYINMFGFKPYIHFVWYTCMPISQRYAIAYDEAPSKTPAEHLIQPQLMFMHGALYMY